MSFLSFDQALFRDSFGGKLQNWLILEFFVTLSVICAKHMLSVLCISNS